MIVKTATDEHILHSDRDLLRFYKEDIERLNEEQIKISTQLVEEIAVFEESAKVYTRMAANIVAGEYWVGGKMAHESIHFTNL